MEKHETENPNTLFVQIHSVFWEHNVSHTAQIEPKNDAFSTVCTLGIENCVHMLSLSTATYIALQSCSIASEGSCNHDR